MEEQKAEDSDGDTEAEPVRIKYIPSIVLVSIAFWLVGQ